MSHRPTSSTGRRRARLWVTSLALGAAVAAPVVAAAPASAAEVGQLCRTNSDAPLYRSSQPGDYVVVPASSLVRILDYRDAYHYLARYSGTDGQLERSRVDQASCYFQ